MDVYQLVEAAILNPARRVLSYTVEENEKDDNCVWALDKEAQSLISMGHASKGLDGLVKRRFKENRFAALFDLTTLSIASEVPPNLPYLMTLMPTIILRIDFDRTCKCVISEFLAQLASVKGFEYTLRLHLKGLPLESYFSVEDESHLEEIGKRFQTHRKAIKVTIEGEDDEKVIIAKYPFASDSTVGTKLRDFQGWLYAIQAAHRPD